MPYQHCEEEGASLDCLERGSGMGLYAKMCQLKLSMKSKGWRDKYN